VGFCKRGEAKDFIRERNTAPGGRLPMNTNGGGLCYMHSGMYGMYAMQESVRQLRGVAAAQVPDATVSVCVGVGGMFAAAGVVIFTSDAARM
jgi:acetyl-CoA acetyltransferase